MFIEVEKTILDLHNAIVKLSLGVASSLRSRQRIGANAVPE